MKNRNKLVRKITSGIASITTSLVYSCPSSYVKGVNDTTKKNVSQSAWGAIDKNAKIDNQDNKSSSKSRRTASVLSVLFPLAGNIYAKGAKGILGPLLMGGATFLGALLTFLGWQSFFLSNEIAYYALNAAPFVIPRIYYGLKAITGNMKDKKGLPIDK